jgi:hypothetical protein
LIGEYCLEALAVIAGARVRPRVTTMLLGTAQRVSDQTGMPRPRVKGTERRLPAAGGVTVAQVIQQAHVALGEAAFTAAWQAGSRLSFAEALAHADAET